jgi:hypothetical protein
MQSLIDQIDFIIAKMQGHQDNVREAMSDDWKKFHSKFAKHYEMAAAKLLASDDLKITHLFKNTNVS